MRAAGLLLLLALGTGCGERRSFEERYNDTEQELQERARKLDQQLEKQDVAEEPAPSQQ